MIRLARIAIREYLAYVRTPGFWLSILLLPLGVSLFAFGPILIERSSPVRELTVVDFTGRNFAPEIAAALKVGPGERPLARLVAAPGAPFASPADATARLKAVLSSEGRAADGERLDAAAIITPQDDTVAISYWSRNVTEQTLEGRVAAAVGEGLRKDRLEAAGLTPAMVAKINGLAPKLVMFSPKAAAEKVSVKDVLPAVSGIIMGALLLMVILSGAGMLLNSIIEEKSSKILEVLLTSASAPEIMGGKILGVAAVSATVMSVWLTIAGVGLASRFPGVAADLGALLIGKGLLFYFAFYFITGYLMFATLYVTIGAFCESVREAQTLLAPMMILMSMPMVFMTQTLRSPDSPMLRFLEWIPLFTPFMMAARAASGPPLWEIVGTGALVLAVTALELWVAIPAFKTGALATGRFEFRKLLAGISQRAG